MKIYRNFFCEDIARSEVAKAQIFDVCVVVDAVAEIKMFILKSKQCVHPKENHSILFNIEPESL